MKYAVLIPDGASDTARPDLDGLTPLQAASTPNIDQLATKGLVGTARTIPRGLPPGSDVANLSVMGYDPNIYYTGRAPLEAASLDITLGKDDIAFRCNLVNVEDGLMADFSAGHISTDEATSLIDLLQQELGSDEISFHPGLSYRHIMVSNGRALKAACTPPHDIIGKPVSEHLPQGDEADWLQDIMQRAAQLLEDHEVNRARSEAGKAPANMIWLWGQGTAPDIPTLSERFGLTGSVISAVDLVKGLGKYAGLEVIEVPGATGYLDTDYGAKGRYAIEELKRKDFVYVHVEAPDEASHMGDCQAKVEAIERFDSELVRVFMDGIASWPEHRILILPDHPTPLEIQTHTDDPVPYLFYDSTDERNNSYRFDEESAAESGNHFERGWELMEKLLGG